MPEATARIQKIEMFGESDPGPGTTCDLSEVLWPKLDESRAIIEEVRKRIEIVHNDQKYYN